MKLTLTPRHGKVFTASDLAAQLAEWVHPGTRGEITATCTFGGKVKTLTLTVEQGNQDPEP